MQVKSLEQLEALLGPEAEAVEDLKRLFALAEGYGYADWLVLDASVVRGLAYYTGGWAAQVLGAACCTGAGLMTIQCWPHLLRPLTSWVQQRALLPTAAFQAGGHVVQWKAALHVQQRQLPGRSSGYSTNVLQHHGA